MTDERKTHFNNNQAQNQDRQFGVHDDIEISVGPDGQSRIKKEIKHLIDPITGRPIRIAKTYEDVLICPNPLGLHEIYREIEIKDAKQVGDYVVCPQCKRANNWRKLGNLLLAWIHEWETF